MRLAMALHSKRKAPQKSNTQPRARTPLTRERAIAQAVALADTDGIAALTMRALAQALGVEAMSLYHHLANKDEILNGMVDFIFDKIELPAPSTDWKAVMRHRANSMRSTLKKHRWGLGLLESRKNPGVATVRHHDAVIGCFRYAGFSLPLTAHAYALVDSYIYGFVLQELNLPLETPEQTTELAGSIMSMFPPGEFRHLVELTMGHVMQPGYAYANEFDWGFELILEGIERRWLAERKETAKPVRMKK